MKHFDTGAGIPIRLVWVGATNVFGYTLEGERRVRVQMCCADHAHEVSVSVVEAHAKGAGPVVLHFDYRYIYSWSEDYPAGHCSTCKATPGQPCRTTRGAVPGAPTGPHRPRLQAYDQLPEATPPTLRVVN